MKSLISLVNFARFMVVFYHIMNLSIRDKSSDYFSGISEMQNMG